MLYGQIAHDLPRDPEHRERAVEQVRRKGQVGRVEQNITAGEVDRSFAVAKVPAPCKTTVARKSSGGLDSAR